MSKEMCVVFDMDGTLADVSEIRHLVMGPKKNFTQFHQMGVEVPPIDYVAQAARDSLFSVVVVTARMKMWEHGTIQWLQRNEIPYAELHMRKNGDMRRDYDVKMEIALDIKRRYDIALAWDDNPQVIDMWNDLNVPVKVVPGWDHESVKTPR